jgi:hypothetical protein
VLRPYLLHQREIAAAPAAEAEIVADEHELRAQFAMQRVYEIHRLHPGKRGSEAAHLHPVHPQRREPFRLFPQAGEPGRRLQRREKLARVRLEHHHRRLQTARPGLGLEALQQGLVPEMHAIEIADGEGDRPPAGCMESAQD